MLRILALVMLVLPTLASAEAASITDTRGEQIFASIPQRVVVSNWNLAQQLLELGVTPVGISDIDGYHTWVSAPRVPESVTDIGLRGEPNLEVLIGLQPDVIILAGDEIAFAKQAERIAPVVHLNTYLKEHDNITEGRKQFVALGALFGKEELAKQKLAEMDSKLALQAEQLKDKFGDNLPVVTMMRFIDAKRVVIYGENSSSKAALDALGLTSEIQTKNSQWGIAYKSVRNLSEIKEGRLLYFEPFQQEADLFDKKLWKALPVVQAGNVAALPSIWSYGGPLTVGQIADSIVEALIK